MMLNEVRRKPEPDKPRIWFHGGQWHCANVDHIGQFIVCDESLQEVYRQVTAKPYQPRPIGHKLKE